MAICGIAMFDWINGNDLVRTYLFSTPLSTSTASFTAKRTVSRRRSTNNSCLPTSRTGQQSFSWCIRRRSPSSSWRSCREASSRAGLAAANRAGPGTITMPKQAPKVSGNSLNCCAVELRCTFAASGEWAECDKTKTKTVSLNSLCFSNCYVHPGLACLMSHMGDEFSGKNPEDRFAGVRHLLSILP